MLSINKVTSKWYSGRVKNSNNHNKQKTQGLDQGKLSLVYY